MGLAFGNLEVFCTKESQSIVTPSSFLGTGEEEAMLSFLKRSSGALWVLSVLPVLPVLSVLLLLPSPAYAQFAGASTGVVKDASGGVLPGVTVEAASPALIEKVRSVITDATGQYRIVDLRPGTYSVTFSLPGFSTVKREGIELSGAFVATVNGEMKVGALEETITVTGETPIVDVQSAKVQQTVSKDRSEERRVGKERK